MSNNDETQVNQNITVTGYPGDKPVATMWKVKEKSLTSKAKLCNMI